MPEVRFYHLERRKLEEALPSLLEEALAQGVKTIVEAPATELLEALDERLWTYSDESFLPHGLARDGEPDKQPILLTAGAENPNGAKWRILIGGAQALPILRAASDVYERLILLFDGADAEALAAARAQWAQLKSSGYAPTYWRQDDTGRWAQAR